MLKIINRCLFARFPRDSILRLLCSIYYNHIQTYVCGKMENINSSSTVHLVREKGGQIRLIDFDAAHMYKDNLEDYEDTDWFNVTVYDKDGNYVMNNCWRKLGVLSLGYDGIRIRSEFLAERGNAYRFTVQVWSSRPNEYGSNLLPDPVPEEYFSPWYYY